MIKPSFEYICRLHVTYSATGERYWTFLESEPIVCYSLAFIILLFFYLFRNLQISLGSQRYILCMFTPMPNKIRGRETFIN